MKKLLAFNVILSLCLISYSPLISQEMMQIRLNRQATQDTRVYYSVFVQSFYDSNGDGIGDLQGLISKLDYLKDLGVGGIWLLPVHPSPTYHKYDITDYLNIHPDYGTLDDYKMLVEEAHKRDLKIMLDLVVNHSSNQHPWFREASSNKKSPYRDYYIWSSNEADFEKEPFHWHQVRDSEGNKLDGERYYGFFWWEMPDLNLDNKKVRKEIISIANYWLEDIGVDGLRLDAIRYIYPDDRLKDNLNWWKEFRKGLGKAHENSFVVAEIWGSSEQVAPYLKNGISAGFNFELSDTIRLSLREGKNHSIPETVESIYERFMQQRPDFEDAIFLTNHDMNRIMTEIGGDLYQAKAAATLLLTLPGNPFIYYGEEIGMFGEKPDEFIREPFLWNIEKKDPGQTSWEIPFASSSRTVKPLEFQKPEAHSLYNTYKELIHLRNNSPGLRSGGIVSLNTGNENVVAYYRTGSPDSYLILVNLSPYMQRIAAPSSLDRYEEVFKTYPVFKGTSETIALQPYSSFILKRLE